MPKKTSVDYQLFALVLALLAFGLASLYSASTVASFENYNTTTRYIFHQLLYGAGLGLLAMLIFSKIDYHKWQKLLPLILLVSLLLLALVRAPGIGFSAGGAARWIHFGPVFFQPAEFAKLATILYLAAWAAKKKQAEDGFIFGLLPTLIIIGLHALLILWQPDFGTMSVIVIIAAVMLFVSGLRLKHFLYLLAIGLIALMLLIKFEPYRYQRLVSFLNPRTDTLGSSYQINQALLAIGAGRLWGYGYGLSRQKNGYLPEPMGDSIFAITAEELGFIRICLLILAFAIFTLRGIKISRHAPDMFGKMLAVGIVTWISAQTLINITSMVGLLPLTGVPLPFFSYGSSSLLINLAALGILLNVSAQTK